MGGRQAQRDTWQTDRGDPAHPMAPPSGKSAGTPLSKRS